MLTFDQVVIFAFEMYYYTRNSDTLRSKIYIGEHMRDINTSGSEVCGKAW